MLLFYSSSLCLKVVVMEMIGKSSVIRNLRVAINKVMNYRPNPYFVAVALMVASIFLLGGGVYNVSTPDISSGLYPYPSLHYQFLNESITIMVIYALGSAGLILIYWSAKYRRNPRQASLLIQIGVALLIIAFIIVEVILYWWKLGYRF